MLLCQGRQPPGPLEAVHSELLVAVGKVLSKEWEESGLDHSKKWSKRPTDLLQRQLPLLLLQSTLHTMPTGWNLLMCLRELSTYTYRLCSAFMIWLIGYGPIEASVFLLWLLLP